MLLITYIKVQFILIDALIQLKKYFKAYIKVQVIEVRNDNMYDFWRGVSCEYSIIKLT